MLEHVLCDELQMSPVPRDWGSRMDDFVDEQDGQVLKPHPHIQLAVFPVLSAFSVSCELLGIDLQLVSWLLCSVLSPIGQWVSLPRLHGNAIETV
eukprot:5843494-Amphidinium_carterae.1